MVTYSASQPLQPHSRFRSFGELSVLVLVFYTNTNPIISNNPYASNTHNKTSNLSSTHQFYPIHPPLHPSAFAQPSLIGLTRGEVIRIHYPYSTIPHSFISCLSTTLSCSIVRYQYFIVNYRYRPPSPKTIFHPINSPARKSFLLL